MKIRIGKDVISAHLVKAEIEYPNGDKFISSSKNENNVFSEWTFTGKTTFSSECLTKFLNRGVLIVKDYDSYKYKRIDESNSIIAYRNGFHKDYELEQFGEVFEDEVNAMKRESPEIDFSWFTGNGYYFKDDQKDIFKNDGAIILLFSDF